MSTVTAKRATPTDDYPMQIVLGVQAPFIKKGDAAEAVLGIFDGNTPHKELSEYVAKYMKDLTDGTPGGSLAVLVSAFNYLYPGCTYRVFLRFR